ncbi:hypothetical protein V1283_007665 [Bradyrhizobium sp. AZCC 2262]
MPHKSHITIAVQVLNSTFIGADPQSVMVVCFGRQ